MTQDVKTIHFFTYKWQVIMISPRKLLEFIQNVVILKNPKNIHKMWVLSNFGDLHIWPQNWPQWLWTSSCQIFLQTPCIVELFDFSQTQNPLQSITQTLNNAVKYFQTSAYLCGFKHSFNNGTKWSLTTFRNQRQSNSWTSTFLRQARTTVTSTWTNLCLDG